MKDDLIGLTHPYSSLHEDSPSETTGEAIWARDLLHSGPGHLAQPTEPAFGGGHGIRSVTIPPLKVDNYCLAQCVVGWNLAEGLGPHPLSRR